jgi:hypothetical protein
VDLALKFINFVTDQVTHTTLGCACENKETWLAEMLHPHWNSFEKLKEMATKYL